MKKLNQLFLATLVVTSLASCGSNGKTESAKGQDGKQTQQKGEKKDIVVESNSDDIRNIAWFNKQCHKINKWAVNSEDLARESLTPNSYQKAVKITQEALQNVVMAMTIEYNLESKKLADDDLLEEAKLPVHIDNPYEVSCSMDYQDKPKRTVNNTDGIVAERVPQGKKGSYEYYVKACQSIEARRTKIYDNARNDDGVLTYKARDSAHAKYAPEMLRRARAYNLETSQAKIHDPNIFKGKPLKTHISNAWDLKCLPD